MVATPRHLTPDLRVWDPWYGRWKPITGVVSAKFEKRGDLGIDTATVTLMGDHPLAAVWAGTSTSAAPVTLNLNGAWWTGRVDKAVRSWNAGEHRWVLTLVSDEKHLHRMLAVGAPQTLVEKPVGVVSAASARVRGAAEVECENVVGAAASRTGLPIYAHRRSFKALEGEQVDVEVRPQDTVAQVLEPVVRRAECFAETRMTVPEEDLGASVGEELMLVCGMPERRWLKAMVGKGWWPHGKSRQVILEPFKVDSTRFPQLDPRPRWAQYDAYGRPLKEPKFGRVFYPYGAEVEYYRTQLKSKSATPHWKNFTLEDLLYQDAPDGSSMKTLVDYYFKGDSGNQKNKAYFLLDNSVARLVDEDVTGGAEQHPETVHFDSYVTRWARGKFEVKDIMALVDLVISGMPVRLGNTLRYRQIDLDYLKRQYGREFDPVEVFLPVLGVAYDYIGSDSEAFYWVEDGAGYLANSRDFKQEADLRSEKQPFQKVPGLYFNLFKERDRTHLQFSTAPGGGLVGWETTHQASDGATVVVGAQWDQWTTTLMDASGGVPKGSQKTLDKAKALEDDALTAGLKKALRKDSTIDGVKVNSAPRNTVGDSRVSFHRLGAMVNMSEAGAWFYRERFKSIGAGKWTAETTAALEEEWIASQGSTGLSMTIGGAAPAVLGDDVRLEDGRVLPGWSIGDRVTFIDGGQTLTEVISGWTVEWGTGKPLTAQPILGAQRDRWTAVDELVDRMAALGERAQNAAVAPSTPIASPVAPTGEAPPPAA